MTAICVHRNKSDPYYLLLAISLPYVNLVATSWPVFTRITLPRSWLNQREAFIKSLTSGKLSIHFLISFLFLFNIFAWSDFKYFLSFQNCCITLHISDLKLVD